MNEAANNTRVKTPAGRNARCEWAGSVPSEQWSVYYDAIRTVRKAGARFLLGGAFGLAGYTGWLRNTKDLDFFVLPREKDKVIDALTKAGFDDFYPQLAYDRGWIYRATRDGMIVDTIWQTPNRRTQVDEAWFQRSRIISIGGENLEIIPAEELLAIKLYVLQRDRCDWPDLLNLLEAACDEMDWPHVIARLGPEESLLAGLLHVFNWLTPEKARCISGEVRARYNLRDADPEEFHLSPYRVQLIDSRPWFHRNGKQEPG